MFCNIMLTINLDKDPTVYCCIRSFIQLAYLINFKFLFPPHRGYISFLHTRGAHRNIIWEPRFLGDIWSPRYSKTFELCISVRPSVRPSVVITIASERKELRTSNLVNRLLLAIGRYWKWDISAAGSGSSHINQKGIPGSWPHGKSDSHQIWYLGLY